jgi:TPR repeat protein
MEMSTDFQQGCPGVRISIDQQAADYTVILNHIELGVWVRDNQIQVADKSGDLISKTTEGGSIGGNVDNVCDLIVRDWYGRAAEKGSAEAEFNLGLLYDNKFFENSDFHRGIAKRDAAQAAVWYGKAADQGLADAQFSLGLLYADGEGVKRDFTQAVEWWRKAADQNNAHAQANLGLLYFKGQGVQRDYAEAYFWLSVSASSYSETDGVDVMESKLRSKVASSRENAAQHLPNETLVKMQQRTSKFLAEHPKPR